MEQEEAIPTEMSAEQQEWHQMFQALDASGDGCLDKSEIKELMFLTKCNPTDSDVDTCFSSIDKNGDEKIDFKEFCTMMKSANPDPEKEMRESIQCCLDKNGDGYIDRTELEDLLLQDGSLDPQDQDLLDLLENADEHGKLPVETLINLIQDPQA